MESRASTSITIDPPAMESALLTAVVSSNWTNFTMSAVVRDCNELVASGMTYVTSVSESSTADASISR